jgi:hypothetical protein
MLAHLRHRLRRVLRGGDAREFAHYAAPRSANPYRGSGTGDVVAKAKGDVAGGDILANTRAPTKCSR